MRIFIGKPAEYDGNFYSINNRAYTQQCYHLVNNDY
jgi:hypothetical protein